MMQNTLLNNLNMNLGRMDKLQNQMASGRKYGHISDDPSALIYGQAARNKLARLGHFQGSVEISQSWLTQAEAGIMELNKVIGAVYEELVSAGSVKTQEDKRNLARVVDQLRDHYVDTLNTSFGDRFIFGGYNTPGDFASGRASDGIKPFAVDSDGNLRFNGFNLSVFDNMPARFLSMDISGMTELEVQTALEDVVLSVRDIDGNLAFADMDEFLLYINDKNGITPPLDNSLPSDPPPSNSLTGAIMMLHQLRDDVLAFDVGPAINMPVTMNGIDVVFYVTVDEETRQPVMRNTFSALSNIYDAINGSDGVEIGTDKLTLMIKTAQDAQNHLLTKTAEIGGRQRRLELLEARYAQDALNYEGMRSDAEDADMAEVIMFLKMAETVYQASLSAGARIIQPTLMDFLR